jgi:hypothetical protein
MNLIDHNPAGQKAELTDFKNPFKKNKTLQIFLCVDNKEVQYPGRPEYVGRIDFWAKVKFKNGMTEGIQDLSAESFPALVEKVNALINSME